MPIMNRYTSVSNRVELITKHTQMRSHTNRLGGVKKQRKLL